MKYLSRYYVAFRCPTCGVGTKDFSVNWVMGFEIVLMVIVGFVCGIVYCNGGM